MVALRRLASAILRRICPPDREVERARNYVRTDEVSGQIQFELLKRERLARNSRLLEIGCGCLNAGIPLIQYLEAGKYFGNRTETVASRSRVKASTRPAADPSKATRIFEQPDIWCQ
jgi:hypothetical protein